MDRLPVEPGPGYLARATPLVAGSMALHAAALLAVAAAPRRWPAIAALVLADHVVLAAAGMTPRSSLLGPNLTRLPAAAAQRGEIALTFDDGPDPEVTPRVLELLEGRGARATFFAVGRRVEAFSEIAAEVARRGHRVENHTHSHPAGFSLLLPHGLRREVERAQEAIERATGRRPALFRAPAGLRSPLLEPVLQRAGLTLASWTRRGFDTVSGDPGRVTRRLLAGMRAGDVLLLHDGSAAKTPGGCPVVLEVLPRVLDVLEERGWKAVPMTGERERDGEGVGPERHEDGRGAGAADGREPSPGSSSETARRADAPGGRRDSRQNGHVWTEGEAGPVAGTGRGRAGSAGRGR